MVIPKEMTMITISMALGALFIWHVISELLHRKERQGLEDRLMARNFDEFKYHQVSLIPRTEALTPSKKDAMGDEDRKRIEAFVSQTEEDWAPEEIDLERLPEVINEPKDDRSEDLER